MNPAEMEFLKYIEQWLAALPSLTVQDVFKQPEKTAILSVDVINGFCKEGILASPRVAAIIPSITKLFQAGWDMGMHNIALIHDCHTPDALEFNAFGQHAVCGTEESEAVDEIKALDFYDQLTIIPKNSSSSSENTSLDQWIADRPELDTFIAVGDCTDICTFSLATHLLYKANAGNLPWRVIVPVDCVETYDLPVETAQQIGAMPHCGDLLHKVFLYEMALNGIEVVKSIE